MKMLELQWENTSSGIYSNMENAIRQDIPRGLRGDLEEMITSKLDELRQNLEGGHIRREIRTVHAYLAILD